MTEKIPFNDLNLQDAPVKEGIDRAVAQVMDHKRFIKGPEVAAFEEAFGAYCGGLCAGVANGTDAIELTLLALGIGPGDEVIAPANTFIATIEAILNVGARPVLVDCRADTLNLDADRLAAAVTPHTKAVVPVHLYGQPADMDAILTVTEPHKLRLIEDAAQAHGADYKGRRAGVLGDAATFSFFPGKNLGAYGDAGAVVSRDPEVVDRVRAFRDHGRAPGVKFDHEFIGRNSRLDSMQAAILGCKLPLLDQWTAARRRAAARYDELLEGVVSTTAVMPDVLSSYHLYVVQVDNRDDVRTALQEEGIATGIHYPVPVHLHSGMQAALGYGEGDFPVAEAAAARILSLPLFTEMTDKQVLRVAETLSRLAGPQSRELANSG